MSLTAKERMVKIGNLVRSRHWTNGEIAIILSFRETWGICTVAIGEYIFDQLISDLEVISESR